MKSLDKLLQDMFSTNDRTVAIERFEEVFHGYYIPLFLLAYRECRSIITAKEALFNLFGKLWTTWMQRSCKPIGFVSDTAWILEMLKREVEGIQCTEETN